MIGVFAAATARLTPEFVESFDPEKLASKFVRVEREFGVKFTKTKSTFNIVGHWESVRNAHKSLLKLKLNEELVNKCTTGQCKDEKIEQCESIVTATTEAVADHAEVNNTYDAENTFFRGKGNPKRGRYATKQSMYLGVPEPVFFFQYQDKTFTDADSLDIDSVLEDFEKSQVHVDKKVTKEDLKKILEKNKDQMGKPLERGIPKGAILPAPKIETYSNNFLVNNVLKSVTQFSGNATGLSDMCQVQNRNVQTSYNYLESGGSALSMIENSNVSDSAMIMTYSVNARMSTQDTNLVVSGSQNGLKVVPEQNHMNFYNHSTDGTNAGKQSNVEVDVSMHDPETFCTIFENYDPQAMINQVTSSIIVPSIAGPSITNLNNTEVVDTTGSSHQVVDKPVYIDATILDLIQSKDIINEHSVSMAHVVMTSSQPRSDFIPVDINRTKDDGEDLTDTSTLEDYTTDDPREHTVTPDHTVTFDVKTFPVTVLQRDKNSASIPLSSNTMNSSMAADAANSPDSLQLSMSSMSRNSTVHSNRAIATMAANVMGVSVPATSYNGQADCIASVPSHNKLNPGFRSVSTASNMKTSYVSSEVAVDTSDFPVDMSTITVEDGACTRNTEKNSEQKLTDAVRLQVKDIAIAADAQYESSTYPVSSEEALAALKEAESILINDGRCEEAGNNQELNGQVSMMDNRTDISEKNSRVDYVNKKQNGGQKIVSPLKIKKSRISGSSLKIKQRRKMEKDKETKNKHSNIAKTDGIADTETSEPKELVKDKTRRKSQKAKASNEQIPVHESHVEVADNTEIAMVDNTSVDSKLIQQEKPRKKLRPKAGSANIEAKEKQIYKCTECDYQGFRKKRLSEHMGRVHGLLANGSVPQNPMFSCDVCDKTFVFEKDLNRHKKIVHHGQIFVCLVCHKNYKSKYVYDRHIATHVEGYIQPKFKCQICEREFTTKFSLGCHIKSEHLGVKKTYSCPMCGKTFSQIRSYRQHANVHAGIRPYTCEICGKSFTYDKSLKEHRYMHDTVRRFQCTVCAKAFRQQTCLLIHMKTHKEKKDHICSVCGREFTQKQSLLRHERIHTGDKPYSCKICYKSFGDYAVIRKHVMMAHKKNKDTWKEEIFTEEKKRSNHYIEGGPGYVPRDSYAKIHQRNQATVIPPVVPGGQIIIAPLGPGPHPVSNLSSQILGESIDSSSQRLSFTEVTPSMQTDLNTLQNIYQIPSYSPTLDLNVVEALKSKPDCFTPVVNMPINYSLIQNVAADVFSNVVAPQESMALKSYLNNIAATPMLRLAPTVCDDVYAEQFLNSPITASKGSMEATHVSEGHGHMTSSVSSAVPVTMVDSAVAASSVTVTTASSSWVYPGYTTAYYTPGTYQYRPSADN